MKNVVKIGRAEDVEKRIKPMKTANPWLTVHMKVETSKWVELEKSVHNIIKLVSKSKQVGTSEFFKLDPAKAEAILMEFKPLFAKDDFVVTKYSGDDVQMPPKPKQTAAQADGKLETKTQLAKRIARTYNEKNEGAFGGILQYFAEPGNKARKPCHPGSKWRAALEAEGIKFDSKDFVIDWQVARK